MKHVASAVVGLIAIGVIGAVAWALLAEPPRWTAEGDILTMSQSVEGARLFVDLRFAAIGGLLSFILASALQVWGRFEWWPGLVIAVGSVISALIAWRLGIMFGPPDPSSVPGLNEGDTVPDRLGLISFPIPLVAWPMGALIGVLVGSFLERDRVDAQFIYDRDTGATTAAVSEISD